MKTEDGQMTELDVIQLVAQNHTKKQMETHSQKSGIIKEELKK